jgi:amino acid permease
MADVASCEPSTNLGAGYTMAISAPTEITAAATIVQFWNASVSPAVWITVFGVFITALNFCNVKLYGEVSTRERTPGRSSSIHA